MAVTCELHTVSKAAVVSTPTALRPATATQKRPTARPARAGRCQYSV